MKCSRPHWHDKRLIKMSRNDFKNLLSVYYGDGRLIMKPVSPQRDKTHEATVAAMVNFPLLRKKKCIGKYGVITY